jgi:hypothetical protein
MHVQERIWRKVHYNALFGDGKRRKTAIAELAENKKTASRGDPLPDGPGWDGIAAGTG